VSPPEFPAKVALCQPFRRSLELTAGDAGVARASEVKEPRTHARDFSPPEDQPLAHKRRVRVDDLVAQPLWRRTPKKTYFVVVTAIHVSFISLANTL
jgi:hypothetical protein